MKNYKCKIAFFEIEIGIFRRSMHPEKAETSFRALNQRLRAELKEWNRGASNYVYKRQDEPRR